MSDNESVMPATTASKSSSSTESPASTLVICRNKHWRYISSFHGSWLQLPAEVLQIICNITYNAPAPAPIDPAVLFDTLRIRRLVDEATTLAVRAAAEDLQSPFGNAGGMSKERKQRIREQACAKLSEAYRIDEIVCSVAAMQGSATLDDVPGQALRRNPASVDAKYAHFFHEKIPSRQMAESTTLEPLDEILEAGGHATAAEVLRTRATVRVSKGDLDGAVRDLTEAMAQYRHRAAYRKETALDVEKQQQQQQPRAPRTPRASVPEEAIPDSLPGQLLFQRAAVYLSLACRHVGWCFPPDNSSAPLPTPPADDEQQTLKRAAAQKRAKNLAKLALRDYMAFLERFQYSPDWPRKAAVEFTQQIDAVTGGYKLNRSTTAAAAAAAATTAAAPETETAPAASNRLYPVSRLFAAVPPAGLPPYPEPAAATAEQLNAAANVSGAAPRPSSSSSSSVCESVTYHPLLTEALHALLLCHCLMQTSAREIQRHAYMVARLVRLSDGYPTFQSCRSPSREDWSSLTRRPAAETGLLPLSASWEDLCAAPHKAMLSQRSAGAGALAAAAAADSTGATATTTTAINPGQQQQQQQQQLVEAAKYTPIQKFCMSYSTTQPSQSDITIGNALMTPGCRLPQRQTTELMRDYPLTTERAPAIAQWLREAPVVAGTSRRKKKAGSGKKSSPVNGDEKPPVTVTVTVQDLSI